MSHEAELTTAVDMEEKRIVVYADGYYDEPELVLSREAACVLKHNLEIAINVLDGEDE